MRNESAAMFDLAPPPRHVPLDVWLRIFLGGGSQFGLGLLCFGLFLGWCFQLRSLIHWHQFHGPLETISGVVTESRERKPIKGPSKPNSKTTYSHAYAFRDPAGVQREGISYATNQTLPAGTPVTVEYPKGRPAVSRIQGMRTERSSALPGILVLLAIGLIFLTIGLLQARKTTYLFQHGQPALATLTSKEEFEPRTGGMFRRHYRMKYEFAAKDGARSHIETVKREPVSSQEIALKDEPAQRLLYDPAQPARASLWDKLPGPLKIDDMGRIRLASAATLARLLFFPMVALLLLGHGLYVFVRSL